MGHFCPSRLGRVGASSKGQLLYVVAFSALLLGSANAQRTPGVTLTIIIGGVEVHFHAFQWAGIKGYHIGVGSALRDILHTGHEPGKDALPRSLVNFVCNGRCSNLPRFEDRLRHPERRGKDTEGVRYSY